MSIEEKLTTIAENQQAVFDAGYNKGKAEGGGGDVQKAFEEGKAQRDYEWWDAYHKQNKGDPLEGERVMWEYAFYGAGWNDQLYNPVRDIIIDNKSNYMFGNSQITNTKKTISMLGGASTDNRYTFRNSNLKTISKLIVYEGTVMLNQFIGCDKLISITIEGTIGTSVSFVDSELLSRASIENVVSCLSDDTKGLTCTFNENAVYAVFDDEEWEALQATKPNWTFAT